MKKLVIGFCAVALATVAQASSFEWSAAGEGGTEVFYSWKSYTETSGNLYSDAGAVTFYLFDAAVAGSQSDMLTALRGGSSITDFTSVQTATLSTESTMANTAFTYGTTGQSYDFYMAAIVNDKVLFSDLAANKPAQQAGTTDVVFGDPGIWSDGDAYDGHPSRNFGDADFAQAGWYNTVPEPTSGLLLLIGMAGLALRRRRA